MCPIPTECGLSHFLWYRHYPRGSCCDLWPEYRWMNQCDVYDHQKQTNKGHGNKDRKPDTDRIGKLCLFGVFATSSQWHLNSKLSISNIWDFPFLEIYKLCLGRGVPTSKECWWTILMRILKCLEVSFKLFEP